MAYLVSNKGNPSRKRLVGGSGEVDVVLKPGSYRLYVKTSAEKEPSANQVSHMDFKVEYKKRYSFTIQ